MNNSLTEASISEQEFDKHMSTELRMTKLITNDLISYDPKIFYQQPDEIEIGRIPLNGGNLKFSIDEKVRACILVTCLGSVRKAHNICNISVQTLSNWKMEAPWWPIIRDQVEQIRTDLLCAKLTEVIEEATDQILERIQEGDEAYDYVRGEKIRIPVKLKDLGDIGLRMALDKREELRGRSPQGTSKKDIQEHLGRLAEAFEGLSKAQKITNLVVDGEFEEVK